MSYPQFDVNNTEVQMIMTIKLLQLQETVMPALSYGVLEEYVNNTLFCGEEEHTLNETADWILSIKPEDLLRYSTHIARMTVRKEGSLQELINATDLYWVSL